MTIAGSVDAPGELASHLLSRRSGAWSRFTSHFTTASGSPAAVFYSSLAIQAIDQCAQRNLFSWQPPLTTFLLLNPPIY